MFEIDPRTPLIKALGILHSSPAIPARIIVKYPNPRENRPLHASQHKSFTMPLAPPTVTQKFEHHYLVETATFNKWRWIQCVTAHLALPKATRAIHHGESE
jgi:hypothetical protein